MTSEPTFAVPAAASAGTAPGPGGPEATATARAAKGRAPHRRDQSARLAVQHAADDLLVERGFGGITIEGIAARAGVAKQTIYRWWPSKVDILMDTLIEDAGRTLAVPVPSEGEGEGATVAGVRRYLYALARFLAENPAGRVLLALIGEAQHDPEVARLFHSRYLDPRRQQELALLQHGVDTGELPANLDIDAALDSLCGPILYRALTGGRITHAFIDGLIAATVTASAGT